MSRGEAPDVMSTGAPEGVDPFTQIIRDNFDQEFGRTAAELEPFGTALGVEAMDHVRGTGGPTGSKGGGNYDDYKTQDE